MSDIDRFIVFLSRKKLIEIIFSMTFLVFDYYYEKKKQDNMNVIINKRSIGKKECQKPSPIIQQSKCICMENVLIKES
jgi:hypothetical protein